MAATGGASKCRQIGPADMFDAVNQRTGSWLPCDRLSGPLIRDLAHFADPLAAPDLSVRNTYTRFRLSHLLELATAHRVLPAVVRHMSAAETTREHDGWSGAAKAREIGIYSIQRIMLAAHAERILRDLPGQPVALVKGPTFAKLIYPTPSLRSYSDIDFLVAPAAKKRVHEVLRDHGFVPYPEPRIADRCEEKWSLEKDIAVLVEVHTNMVHAPSLRNSLSLEYEHLAEVGILTPAAQLVVASMHAALHQFDTLRQVVDVLQAARNLFSVADEERLEFLVERTGSRLATVAALDLAGRTYGDRRCIEISRSLRPVPYAGLARTLITPRVVVVSQTPRRWQNGWRRRCFREALKRSRFAEAFMRPLPEKVK